MRPSNLVAVMSGAVLLAAALHAGAQSATVDLDPAARGLAIAREADEKDSGFKDETANLQMILRNRNGDQSIRALRIKVIEQDADGDKSLVVFDEPADVKGTALLTFSHKQGDDDQWLYLPALERVKRISSSNQSGPFMGSEFAFEDFTSQEVEKFDYNYLREDTLEGRPVHVYERDPLHAKSGYTRQVMWLDNEYFQPLKIEYYDRKNDLLKVFEGSEYTQYADRYWRAHRMDMENVQTGKSTTILWDNFAFGTGLRDRDFDRNSLASVR
ncbi:MAG: outer membrane lipoprotein-sorting protein [Candidatus Hydrogenedentales bacterium]